MDPQQQQRPASTRGVASPLADRVTLYCRQTSAANNAAVMRTVLKPSADEMLDYLQREAGAEKVYSNPTLMRVLLTDSDYDSVSREVLSLSDAIEWHSQQTSNSADTQPQSPSTSRVLEMMLQSEHVFSLEQITAAKQLAVERGLESAVMAVSAPKLVEGGDTHNSDDVDEEDDFVSHRTNSEDEPTKLAHAKESKPHEKREAELCEDAMDTRGGSKCTSEENFDPASISPSVIAEAIGDLDQEKERPTDGELPEENEPSGAGGVMQDSLASIEHIRGLKAVGDEVITDGMPETSEAFACVFDGEASSVDQDEQADLSAGSAQPSSTINAGDVCTQDSLETETSVGGVCVEQAETPQEKTEIDSDVPARSEVEVPLQSANSEDSDVRISTGNAVEVASSPVPLTHSYSTVERIVRTLDKQLQGPETEELDASIERAINHDAELLQRRYSGIAEEGESSPTGALREIQSSTTQNEVCESMADATLTENQLSGSCGTRDTSVYTLSEPAVEPIPVDVTLPVLETPVIPDEVLVVPKFRVGEAVEARYRGWNRYFQGEIAAVVDAVSGVYEVRYADGDYEANVPANFIRRIPDEQIEPTASSQIMSEPSVDAGARYAVGDHVEALYRGRTHWYAGRVTKVYSSHTVNSAPTYDVEYDDGETEKGVADHHVRPRAVSATSSAGSSTASTVALIESANVLVQSCGADDNPVRGPSPIAQAEEPAQEEQATTERPLRIGDRVYVGQHSHLPLIAWIVGIRASGVQFDVLYDADGGGTRAGEKEVGVECSRVQRLDAVHSVDGLAIDLSPREAAQLEYNKSKAIGNQENEAADVTPVVPFNDNPEADDSEEGRKKRKNLSTPVPSIIAEATRFLAQVDDEVEENESQANILSDRTEDEDGDVEEEEEVEDSILQSTALFKPATPRVASATPKVMAEGPAAVVSTRKPTAKRKKPFAQKQQSMQAQPQEPVLSETTLRYLSPQRQRLPERPRTGRSQASTTPRVSTASRTKIVKSKAATAKVEVSWKELEEWKNVDLILNRKRRIVNNGQVEGSEVPWGEEFAAIQSLKRFAQQYPDVLRDHIDHQLQEVVNSSATTGVARPMTTTATAAARDALLLIKDLAFLLRHRLAPFLDSILPVVLPAVFHSQKRFLCDTAYQVLEALVAHCSSRKLVVALFKQALQFPREDMRLVNLTCLYIEKCLTNMSFAAVQELMTRSTVVVLEAISELLSCKSAACQSSLQKSLLLVQEAIGEDTMECELEDHLKGNALAIVRKHLALAMSASVQGPNKSPQSSPKKHQATPAKQAAVAAASPGGSMSILQRMLLQRQNRVAPE